MESEGIEMRAEYDFSSAKKNPYLELLKNQVTITLDENVVNFFKKQSESVGIPYQNLINLYLRDCMVHDRHPEVSWK